jgi:hypothetical protein
MGLHARISLLTATFVCLILNAGSSLAATPCDIAAIGSWNPGDNDYVNVAEDELRKLPGIIVLPGIQNIFDLVSKLENELAVNECTCLRNLYLVDHGSSGNISVGGGQSSTAPDEHIDGHKMEWEVPLLELPKHFCPDATLHLVGCNVGACNAGSKKLSDLSDALGVVVRGAVDMVVAEDIRNYLNNGRWQETEPGAGAPACMRSSENKPPKKGKKGFWCPCNKTLYSSLGECVTKCNATLGCFSGICAPKQDEH